MNASTATSAGHRPADDGALSMAERLSQCVREALVNEQFGSLDMKVELVTMRIMAELCPPNHLLLSAEVVREHDAGINDPSGYEPPYDYAAAGNFKILHDTLEDESAEMLAYAAEIGDAMPDGTAEFERAILGQLQPKLPALPRENADTPSPIFGPMLSPATNNNPDRSTT